MHYIDRLGKRWENTNLIHLDKGEAKRRNDAISVFFSLIISLLFFQLDSVFAA